MLTRLIDFLKRSPGTGGRKVFEMSTESANPPAPTTGAPHESSSPPADEFHRQLLSLGDAVRELSRSQQALIDAVTRKASPASPPVPAPQSISGDPGDGLRPSAVVDYARLSPVQQIALGLHTATPQGPRVLPTRAPASEPQDSGNAERAGSGAD